MLEYYLSQFILDNRYVTVFKPGVWILNRFTPEGKDPIHFRDNLKIDRMNRLKQSRENSNNLNFEKTCKELFIREGLSLIPEYSVILDRELWKSCYEGRDLRFIKRNYISLDYFIPELGIVIELDSTYHEKNEQEDLARDLYLLKKYGVRTLRFRGFGCDDSNIHAKLKSDLEDQITGLRGNRLNPSVIDQREFLVKELSLVYSEELRIIDSYFNLPENFLLPSIIKNGFDRKSTVEVELCYLSDEFEEDRFFKVNLNTKRCPDPYRLKREITYLDSLIYLLTIIFKKKLPERILSYEK